MPIRLYERVKKSNEFKMIPIQTQILRYLYDETTEKTTKQIAEGVGLELPQVYEAIRHLKRRHLIKINREIGKAGYQSPPKGTIKVELNENVIPRIVTIINRDKNA